MLQKCLALEARAGGGNRSIIRATQADYLLMQMSGQGEDDAMVRKDNGGEKIWVSGRIWRRGMGLLVGTGNDTEVRLASLDLPKGFPVSSHFSPDISSFVRWV